jgi:hypothetical protein
VDSFLAHFGERGGETLARPRMQQIPGVRGRRTTGGKIEMGQLIYDSNCVRTTTLPREYRVTTVFEVSYSVPGTRKTCQTCLGSRTWYCGYALRELSGRVSCSWNPGQGLSSQYPHEVEPSTTLHPMPVGTARRPKSYCTIGRELLGLGLESRSSR